MISRLFNASFHYMHFFIDFHAWDWKYCLDCLTLTLFHKEFFSLQQVPLEEDAFLMTSQRFQTPQPFYLRRLAVADWPCPCRQYQEKVTLNLDTESGQSSQSTCKDTKSFYLHDRLPCGRRLSYVIKNNFYYSYLLPIFKYILHFQNIFSFIPLTGVVCYESSR